MALFFDQEWFDARLKEAGRTRDDVAAALRLSRVQVDEIWKDQRELAPHEVGILAGLLGEAPAAVANKAGVSTPVPVAPKTGDAGAWAPRLALGHDALTASAIAGKNAMPPRGGAADLTDTEVKRAVAYLANLAGANFTEPPVEQ